MEDEIKKFFTEYPETHKLFTLICSYIDSLGEINVEVMKTQISFGTKKKFAWIWLPQTWVKGAPANGVVLTVGLRRRIEHPKVKEIKEPYPGRFTHHIVLLNKSDFNDDIKGILKEAYDNSAL